MDTNIRIKTENGYIDLERFVKGVSELILKQVDLLENRIKALEAGIEQLRSEQDKTMKYRGVFEQGLIYQPGDTVSHSGTIWVCRNETASKPPGQSWQLAVKSH